MSIDNKIVIVHNLKVGGAPIMLNEIKNELINRNLPVEVLSPDSIEKVTHSNNKILNYLNYCYRYLPKYYKKLSLNLNKSKTKLVIVFQDQYLKTPNIFKYLKIKSIYFFADPPREFYENMFNHTESVKNIIFNILFRSPVYFIDRCNIKHSKHNIAISKYIKRLLKNEYGVDSNIIYPGIRKFIKNNHGLIIRDQFLSMGNFLPYKGHEIVIKAIGGMPIAQRKKLVIVGSGSDKAMCKLEKLAKKLKVEIEIIRSCTDQELKEIYLKTAVYINGAQCEPFGLTSLEALNFGCKLVTNNTGGTKELKKFFKNNVYVSKNEVDSMSECIIKSMMCEYQDQKIPKSLLYKYLVDKILEI